MKIRLLKIIAFVILTFISFFTLAKEPKLMNAEIGLHLSSQYTFRGMHNTSDTESIFVDFSTYGISTTARINRISEEEANLADFALSYSYSMGFFDVGIGFFSSEFPISFVRNSSEELFFELKGNPEWNGTLPFEIIPSLKQSFNINSEAISYTHLTLPTKA